MIKTTITTPKAISLKYGGFIGIPIDVLIIGVNIITYLPVRNVLIKMELKVLSLFSLT